MKRRKRAWVSLTKHGGIKAIAFSKRVALYDADIWGWSGASLRVVPCVVEYDDGKDGDGRKKEEKP